MEQVLVIDHGRIVSGPAIAVAEFTAGRTVWDRLVEPLLPRR
jgi:hypothetical protein